MGAACTLFTDLSGLDDPPAQNVPDAVADQATSTDDANVPIDSAAAEDATITSDAGGCPDGSFCDNFDLGAVGDNWDELGVLGASTIGFDEKDYRSAPRSLRAMVDASPSTGTRQAYVRRGLSLAKGVRCSLDVRVNGTLDTDYHVDFLQIKAANAQISAYSLRLYLLGEDSAVREDFALADGGCLCPKKMNTFTAIPRNKWTKVVFETDFNEATVKYDGAVVFKQPYAGFTPTSIGVLVGIQTYDRAAWDIQYDDLRCDPLL